MTTATTMSVDLEPAYADRGVQTDIIYGNGCFCALRKQHTKITPLGQPIDLRPTHLPYRAKKHRPQDVAEASDHRDRSVSLPIDEIHSELQCSRTSLSRNRIVSMPEDIRTDTELFSISSTCASNTHATRTEDADLHSLNTPVRTPSPFSSPDSVVIVGHKSPQVSNTFLCDNTSKNSAYNDGWVSWATTTPQPIPALHGPLSLPYARCPSGAEGTLVEGKNLSRVVWGLNATSPANCIGMKTSAQYNPRRRPDRSVSVVEQTPCGGESSKFRYGRTRAQGEAALQLKQRPPEFDQSVNETVSRRSVCLELPSDWYDATSRVQLGSTFQSRLCAENTTYVTGQQGRSSHQCTTDHRALHKMKPFLDISPNTLPTPPGTCSPVWSPRLSNDKQSYPTPGLYANDFLTVNSNMFSPMQNRGTESELSNRFAKMSLNESLKSPPSTLCDCTRLTPRAKTQSITRDSYLKVDPVVIRNSSKLCCDPLQVQAYAIPQCSFYSSDAEPWISDHPRVPIHSQKAHVEGQNWNTNNADVNDFVLHLAGLSEHVKAAGSHPYYENAPVPIAQHIKLPNTRTDTRDENNIMVQRGGRRRRMGGKR